MTYTLAANTPAAEVAMFQEIYSDYLNAGDKFAFAREIVIKAFSKTWINFGGFNGNPTDLWLRVRGTSGQQRRTFWRTGIQHDRVFGVSIYDLRTANVGPANCHAIAEANGLKIIGKSLFHFTTDSALELTRKVSQNIQTEADNITLDEEFATALKWADEAAGKVKSERCASAFKGLLERNNKEQIETDFWQVFRILKVRAQRMPLDAI